MLLVFQVGRKLVILVEDFLYLQIKVHTALFVSAREHLTHFMDYNTQRDKLVMPEYGRHVQNMIEQVKQIEDRDKRNEQIRAVVQVMCALNPQKNDLNDFKHKLWDHMQIIADYDIDVDAPYPVPERKDIEQKPEPIALTSTQIKAACYGRNIENMINLIATREDDDDKKEMIRMLALYMRQQYLIWNKDSVAEETIFSDIEKLSGGKLKVPSDVHLSSISGDVSFTKPGIMGQNPDNSGKTGFKRKNRKRSHGNRPR